MKKLCLFLLVLLIACGASAGTPEEKLASLGFALPAMAARWQLCSFGRA